MAKAPLQQFENAFDMKAITGLPLAVAQQSSREEPTVVRGLTQLEDNQLRGLRLRIIGRAARLMKEGTEV